MNSEGLKNIYTANKSGLHSSLKAAEHKFAILQVFKDKFFFLKIYW